MNQCPVDPVPLALVLPLAALAFAFGLGVYMQAPTRMDDAKKSIRTDIGSDPASGVPYRATKGQQGVLDFDVSRRLRRLPFWLGLTVVLIVTYVVAELVPAPSNELLYSCAITVGSVITLLPPLIAVLLGITVLAKLRRPSAT